MPSKDNNEVTKLTSLLNEMTSNINKQSPQESMAKLALIVHLKASYVININNGDSIMSRDSLSYLSGANRVIYESYLNEWIPKDERFFISHFDINRNNELVKHSFRQVKNTDVIRAIKLQREVITSK